MNLPFIQLMARKMRDFDNEEEYIEAFKLFDKNLDDLISIDELRDVMSILQLREMKLKAAKPKFA